MIRTKWLMVLAVCLLATVVYAATVHRTLTYSMDFVGDTLADTSSGDGKTNLWDTIPLFKPMDWNTLVLRAVIKSPLKDTNGIGDLDSVYWRVIRQHWGVTDILAAESAAAPDTFKYFISGANDTVMRGDWKLVIGMMDTLTQKRVVTTYPVFIEWEAIPIE